MDSGVLLLLAVILIHSRYGILRACEVTVSQPAVHKAVVSQHSVTLPCQIKEPRCPGDFDTYWFRYLASVYEELDTAAHNSRFSSKKSAFNTTLKIKGLQIEDSGVYVCGIAFNDAVATGIGTTLVVRERETSIVTPACITLIFFCILLLVYSASVFFLYGYRSKWKQQKCLANRRSHPRETEKRSTARQRVFRAIAQEYHKRYPRKKDTQNEMTEDDTIYQNT